MQAPHIVIIDENIQWLLRAKSFLENKGYFVVIKEEGTAGWQYLKSQPVNIDLVLLDFMVADMEGLELLERLRQHPQMHNLLIVMQGMQVTKAEVKEATDLKAAAYIAKPYTEEQLLTIVETVLTTAGKPLAELAGKLHETEKKRVMG